jgi:S-adenosylmethionine:diacylglycerol 3-amino-3-carboxypropyl transferase
MPEIVFKWVFILLAPFYLFIFRGLFIAYQIQVGRYKSKELDEFPLYFTDELEYESIVNGIKAFIGNIRNGDNTCLSLSSNDINSLVYSGSCSSEV